MPALLSEMGSLSILSPQNVDVNPRFANPPQVQPEYKDYTVIEDVFACQTALPQGTQLDSTMPAYNSNAIIPSYHQATCPNPAQQTLLNFSQPGYLPADNMYVPHQQNMQSYVNAHNAAFPQFNTTFQYPPFAGAVPYMKQARLTDQTIPLREGYAPTASPTVQADSTAATTASNQTQQCVECMKHINDCGFCQKIQNTCNNTKWYIIVGILILVIAILVIYILMSRKGNVVNELTSTGITIPKILY